MSYTEGKTFEKTDFSKTPLPKGEYERCIFNNCNFSETDLSWTKFTECIFTGSNLSSVKLNNAVFKDVKFKECKMLGMHFEFCDHLLFSVGFENCTLNLSSFFKLKMKKTEFKSCVLQEVDFAETDLSGSSFNNCDLKGAIFENTILEKTDFRTAFNYSMDPEMNKMKKARFAVTGLPGLLGKYGIDIE